jgi:hypothetical protein
MDVSRLGRGERIAAISAIALLLIMSLFNWYGSDVQTWNAWQAFALIDLILFLAIVAAIGMAVLSMGNTRLDLPASPAMVTLGLGAFSALLVLYRIIDPPGLGFGQAAEAFGVDLGIGRSIGIYLGLIAAAGIAYGGWLARQDEMGRSAPRDRRGDPAGPQA